MLCEETTGKDVVQDVDTHQHNLFKTSEVEFVKKGQKVHEVQALKDGQAHWFGERALLKKDVRECTVRVASANCTCLALTRSHFEALLGPLQELMVSKINEQSKPAVPAKAVQSKRPKIEMSDLKRMGLLGRRTGRFVRLLRWIRVWKIMWVPQFGKCSCVLMVWVWWWGVGIGDCLSWGASSLDFKSAALMCHTPLAAARRWTHCSVSIPDRRPFSVLSSSRPLTVPSQCVQDFIRAQGVRSPQAVQDVTERQFGRLPTEPGRSSVGDPLHGPPKTDRCRSPGSPAQRRRWWGETWGEVHALVEALVCPCGTKKIFAHVHAKIAPPRSTPR